MRLKINLLILINLLLSCHGKSQNRITIHIPTAESESEYVWRTLQDIKFFEENKYQISLPKGQLIEELKAKSKKDSLSEEDYKRLKTYIKDSIYHRSDYLKGFERIENERVLINKMVREIAELKLNWNFKLFDNYEINLTLYGPGGSYDPDEGSILIFTTPEGKFKNYANPANTIIHEITHIGIEETIIIKFQVPHTLKERIVDTFVFLNFNQYLPDYRIQDMGEKRPDQYLKTKINLKDLSNFVEIIMKEKK